MFLLCADCWSVAEIGNPNRLITVFTEEATAMGLKVVTVAFLAVLIVATATIASGKQMISNKMK